MTPSIPSAEVAMKLALVGRYSYAHFTAAGIMISEAIVMNASYQFHMYKILIGCTSDAAVIDTICRNLARSLRRRESNSGLSAV